MAVLYSITSGVLGALAFPKLSLWPFIFVFLAPFFFSLSKARSPLRLAALSFVFGLFYFGVLFEGLSILYLYVSFAAYGAWLGLVLFQSLFIVLFSLYFRYLLNSRFHKLLFLFLVPAGWVVLEWLRSLGPFGVSGGILGYAVAGILPLVQIASLTGVYGVSFLVVLVNTLVFQVAREKGSFLEKTAVSCVPISIVFLLMILTLYYGYYRLEVGDGAEREPIFRAAMIQPNVKQLVKLDFTAKMRVFNKHVRLTRQVISSKPDLVLWPETVVRTYLSRDRVVARELAGLIRDTGSYFIIGFPHHELTKVYNSAYLFSPSGSIVARYDKQKPVPFGEYLPLRSLLYPLLRRFGARHSIFENGYDFNPDPKLLPVLSRNIGMAICFESTFPYLLRQRVRAGADAIVVITNDAWFGSSSLAFQHFDISVFRAIETGIPLLQVANTGISGVVDSKGRVLEKIGIDREIVLVTDVPQGEAGTFYSTYGNLFVGLLAVLCVAALLIRKALSLRGPV